MVLSNLGDSDLITSYINGNEKAFETLLLRHKDRVYRYIYSKLKDSQLSNDIFQDTFVKVVNTIKLGNYNEEGKFLPWCMRIAHNLVIDHFRRQSKMRMISETSPFDSSYSIFHKIDSGEDNYLESKTKEELENQMVYLIDYLPEVQKEIIRLRIFQDLSFKEIAELKDISINTALGRMRYALINMRKLIDKHNLVTHF
ncbi:MAG: sigma-70 family RNA polymerase sigma factor [Crocinitomicaceae bacterium]|nr:sigma-70 family RNA polymerase sigma factor [Crocinitomicaceae bacterium]